MIPKITVFDTLSPTARRWAEELSPSARRAWRKVATRGRVEARASADRYLRTRTGAGRRGITSTLNRGTLGWIVTIWPSVGYMAAHELGSTIPAWKKRPAFSLPRRPWATAALPAIERAAVDYLEQEVGKVFDLPGFSGRRS